MVFGPHQGISGSKAFTELYGGLCRYSICLLRMVSFYKAISHVSQSLSVWFDMRNMTKYFQINRCLWDCDLNWDIYIRIHRFLLSRPLNVQTLSIPCVKSTILHFEVQPVLFEINVLLINKLPVALNTDGSWRTFTAIWDEYCLLWFISLFDSVVACYVWLRFTYSRPTREFATSILQIQKCLIFSSTVFLQLV